MYSAVGLAEGERRKILCECRIVHTGSSFLEHRTEIDVAPSVDDVTESELHRSMKNMVRGQLQLENYHVVEEPLYPPAEWIHWEAYRPDLLGSEV